MMNMHSFSQRHELQTRRASVANMSIASLIARAIREDDRLGYPTDETLAALACRPIEQFRHAARHSNPAIRKVAIGYLELICEGAITED